MNADKGFDAARKPVTYLEQFESAMKCKTKAEARHWMVTEIGRYVTDFGKTPDEAERIIRENLGYMAGYFDSAVAEKIYDLFCAEHPVFGQPGYWGKLSAENCLRLGREMAGGKS